MLLAFWCLGIPFVIMFLFSGVELCSDETHVVHVDLTVSFAHLAVASARTLMDSSGNTG
jgi:hypothetical protein